MRAGAASVAAFSPWIAWWGTWLASSVAGAMPARPAADPGSVDAAPPRLDVLIPAHDEEASIGALLASIGAGTAAPGLGTVLVVADHCADATADASRAAGAEVMVRDTGPRGKPAALRDGLAVLASRPGRGAGVIMLDADCVCSPGLVAELAGAVGRGAQAAQAAYELEAGAAGAAAGVEIGVYLRNVLRPAGHARMGLPVQLTGSGIALTWEALGRVDIADDLAEDTRLSYDLLRAGVHAAFVPSARVTSPLPDDESALSVQRRRWEGGQAALLRGVPGLLASRLARRDLRGALAVVDWSAPPLSAAVAGWAGAAGIAGGLVATRRLPPAALAGPALAGSLLAAYLAVGAAAAGGGPRGLLAAARALPGFAAWKLRFYLGEAGRPRSASQGWTRTPRAGDPERRLAGAATPRKDSQ